MTVLDNILNASTDPSIPTSDLLRRVQIAAHRLGATEIVAWARNELSGYPSDAQLPGYREVTTSVHGLFTGPMNASLTHTLPPGAGLEQRWEVTLRQPLVELQSLADASGDNDPRIEWGAWDVQTYRRAGVFTIQFYDLFSVWNKLTKQSLLGMIDVVRTRAMEFALELQTAFPDAGEVGGPTVAATPGLAQTVYNITNTSRAMEQISPQDPALSRPQPWLSATSPLSSQCSRNWASLTQIETSSFLPYKTKMGSTVRGQRTFLQESGQGRLASLPALRPTLHRRSWCRLAARFSVS